VAIDSASASPVVHLKVGLFALLAAPLAASFGHVSDRGPRLLLRESLAVQEQEEICQGLVELDQIVAQRADASIAAQA
jgi:hypothetical protein